MKELLDLKMAFAVLLFCLGCSSSSGTATSTPCNGNTPCIQSPLACIDPGTAVCDTKLAAPGGYTGYCAFRLKVSSSCACIETTVQHCNLPAGGAGGAPLGIQDCVVAGGPTTSWGGCHS
jgi:hypothetical protein